MENAPINKDGTTYSGPWENGELVDVSGFQYNRSHNSSTNDCPTFNKSLDKANITVPW